MDGKDIEGRVDRMQAQIRNDFPILEQKINNNPLIYFDNGATTQMPNCVLECLNRHYMQDNANVHRGIHTLSERSTCAMEDARKTVADFIVRLCGAVYAKRQEGDRDRVRTSFQFCPVAAGSETDRCRVCGDTDARRWQTRYRSIGTGTGRVRGDRFGDCNLQCDRNGTSGA